MIRQQAKDKTVAIVQSNYIPWKGYFDLIHMADEFVLLDDVQYTRRDWRNRNKIKTPQGLKWLSIPVDVKGKYEQKIKETQVADGGWAGKHWQSLRHAYAKAPQFRDFAERVEGWYTAAAELTYLSEINHLFISEIAAALGIDTILSRPAVEAPDDKSDRLLQICLHAEATRYLSGPAARNYLDEGLFSEKGIEVDWMDYSDYPTYPQLHGEFEHGVTVLDLLFNAGADAPRHMRSFPQHR